MSGSSPGSHEEKSEPKNVLAVTMVGIGRSAPVLPCKISIVIEVGVEVSSIVSLSLPAGGPCLTRVFLTSVNRQEMEDVEVFGETTRTCVEANETQDADGTIGNTRQPSVSTKKSKFVTRLHVEQSLTSVGAIVDGSAFRPLKSNKGDRVCCFKYRCNLQFTATEAQAIRDEVPAVGKQGCRALRKAYVQQWTADDPGGSHKLMLGPRKQEVCVAFFNILTGISKDLIYAARKLEDPAP